MASGIGSTGSSHYLSARGSSVGSPSASMREAPPRDDTVDVPSQTSQRSVVSVHSSVDLRGKSEPELFDKLLKEGQSEKWVECTQVIKALQSHPCSETEQIYLLAEEAYALIELEEYDEALENITLARSIEENSIHEEYLAYLEAKALFLQGNHNSAITVATPSSNSARINSYHLMLKTLAYMHADQIEDAGKTLEDARILIDTELSQPQFPDPPTLKNTANSGVYLQSVRETTQTVKAQFSQLEGLYKILSQNKDHPFSIVSAEQAAATQDPAEYNRALLSVYALILQNDLGAASTLFSALPKEAKISRVARATYNYLGEFLPLQSETFLKTPPSDLLFPISRNEHLFLNARDQHLRQNFSNAIKLYQLLQRTLVSLLSFEIAIKCEDLSCADLIENFPEPEDEILKARLLICKIELLTLQNRHSDAEALIRDKASLLDAFPNVRAYLLSKEAFRLLESNPTLALSKATEAITLVCKPEAQPTGALRYNELFLSRFETRQTTPLPFDVITCTIIRSLNDIKTLASHVLGMGVTTDNLTNAPHLQAYILITEKKWAEAEETAAAAVHSADASSRIMSYHQGAFVHLVKGNFVEAQRYLKVVVSSNPDFLKTHERQYCSILLSLLEGDLIAAKHTIREILKFPEELSRDLHLVMSLAQAHLEIVSFPKKLQQEFQIMIDRTNPRIDHLVEDLKKVAEQLNNHPKISRNTYDLLFDEKATPLFTNTKEAKTVIAYRTLLRALFSQLTTDIYGTKYYFEQLKDYAPPFFRKTVFLEYAVYFLFCNEMDHAMFITQRSQAIEPDENTSPKNHATSPFELFSANAHSYPFIPLLLCSSPDQQREIPSLSETPSLRTKEQIKAYEFQVWHETRLRQALLGRNSIQALYNLEIVLYYFLLPKQRIAHLYAEKAYLLFSIYRAMPDTRPDYKRLDILELCIAASNNAKKNQPTRTTLAYLELIRGRIMKEKHDETRAFECFTKALEIDFSSTPLRLLIYTEWLLLAVHLEKRNAIATQLPKILALFTQHERAKNTSRPSWEYYLDRADQDAYFLTFAFEHDLTLSAGLALVSVYLMTGRTEEANKLLLDKLSKYRGEILPYFILRNINLGEYVPAHSRITGAITQNPAHHGYAYLQILVDYCKNNGDLPVNQIEAFGKSTRRKYPYFFDVGFERIRRALTTQDFSTAEIQTNALLLRSTLPQPLKNYLLGVQALLTDNITLIEEARSSLPDGDILHIYLDIITMKIHAKTEQPQTAPTLRSKTNILNQATPHLCANYFFTRCKYHFHIGEYQRAKDQAILGLEALMNRENRLALFSPDSTCFFHFHKQRGTLPPCIPQRAELSESLFKIAIKACQKLDGNQEDIFNLTRRMLELPQLKTDGEKRAEYLYLCVESGMKLEKYDEVLSYLHQLTKLEQEPGPKKTQIDEWNRITEEKLFRGTYDELGRN